MKRLFILFKGLSNTKLICGGIFIGALCVWFNVSAPSENLLITRSMSRSIMNESTVFYDEAEKEYPSFFSRNSPKFMNDTTIEARLIRDVPKLLDLDNAYYGWTTVLTLYKKTLGDLTVKDLIANCRELASGSYYDIGRIDYVKRKEAAKKFCSFPERVRDKITPKEVYRYREWTKKSKINRFWNKVNSREAPEVFGDMDEEKYCRWYLSNYTVYGDMTLEEVDFIKSCYATLLS